MMIVDFNVFFPLHLPASLVITPLRHDDCTWRLRRGVNPNSHGTLSRSVMETKNAYPLPCISICILINIEEEGR